MARFNNGFFTSDHSNIEILDKEVHVVSDIANGALSNAQTASDTAQAALNTSQTALDTSQTALNNVNAFSTRLDALEAAQGTSDVAGVVGDTGALVGDGTGVVGDAAALVGDVTETIGASDKIMLYCTIASAVAVTVMVAFVVFCFYQGITHEKDGKEGERKSSSADQDMQKENQKWIEPFESDLPISDLYESSIQHSFHQSQQRPIQTL